MKTILTSVYYRIHVITFYSLFLFLFSACLTSKPIDACECAGNQKATGSSAWSEDIAVRCEKYASSLSESDRAHWEKEVQDCMGPRR